MFVFRSVVVKHDEPLGSLNVGSGEAIIVIGECEEPKASLVEKVCQKGFSVATALRALRFHKNNVKAAIKSLNNSERPELYLLKEIVDKDSKEFPRCWCEMYRQGISVPPKDLAMNLLLDPDMFPATDFQLVSLDTHVGTTSSAVADLDLPKVMKEVQLRADAGDMDSQFWLGRYLKRYGNVAIGAQYLKMAADQGHMMAQYKYAKLLLSRGAGACDECEVSHYLKLSAEQGFAPAMYLHALRLKLGMGLERNIREAARYYTELARQGDAVSQLHLASCLLADVETDSTCAVNSPDEDIADSVTDDVRKKENIMEARLLLEHCLETDLTPYHRSWAIALYGCTFIGSADSRDSEQYIRGMHYLKQAADAGNKYAAMEYGNRLADTDLETGLEYLKQAAKSGSPDAQQEYATAIACYRGVDPECCFYWKKSGEQGDPVSLRSYGICLHYGICVAMDKRQAVQWFKMAAEAGDARGKFLYGKALSKGRYVSQDTTEAMRYVTMAANAGIPEAMLLRGQWIADSDKLEALRCFRRAADMGLVDAQMEYGRMLLCDSNHWDNPEGIRYVKMAADSGLRDAILLYGKVLFSAERTRKEGVRYIKMAADAGVAEAQAIYGAYLSTDEYGAEVNYEQALFYLRKAADQLVPSALNDLGRLYANGLGTERNLFIAARCFRESAHLGSPAGQLNYALCLEKGHGVKRDPAAAYKLRQEAAAKMSEEKQKQ